MNHVLSLGKMKLQTSLLPRPSTKTVSNSIDRTVASFIIWQQRTVTSGHTVQILFSELNWCTVCSHLGVWPFHRSDFSKIYFIWGCLHVFETHTALPFPQVRKYLAGPSSVREATASCCLCLRLWRAFFWHCWTQAPSAHNHLSLSLYHNDNTGACGRLLGANRAESRAGIFWSAQRLRHALFDPLGRVLARPPRVCLPSIP
jgi:hypothetical protein